MKTVAEKLQELKDREEQIKAMGGAKAVDKQTPDRETHRPGAP